MTTRPLDYPPTVANLVRHAAAHFPAGDYLVTPDRRLGFGDAEAQSRRLALRLLRGGVGKGTRVAIMFPQGPDFIVALLAVTRIGALAVPLSTFLRGPELRRAIRHADVHLVVAPRMLLGQDTQDLLEATWPELATTPAPELFLREAPYLRRVWLCGDVDRPWATGTPVFADLDDLDDLDHRDGPGDDLLREVEGEVRPSDPMVMIHTSGATAEPKAVVHTHGAQVRHSWTLAQLYRLTEETRTFTTMPFFWVGGLTVSLLSHLHVGGAVLTVERMEPRTMLDLIEGEGATRVIGWTLAATSPGWSTCRPPVCASPGCGTTRSGCQRRPVRTPRRPTRTTPTISPRPFAGRSGRLSPAFDTRSSTPRPANHRRMASRARSACAATA
jgi:acyl-CoA synthetase (AMP-forming)/AMP-acid ligase II